MIELPYSWMTEATEESKYFGLDSPDIQGFTGIGHSVEDSPSQARWGMQEFVDVMKEKGIPVPFRDDNPTFTIMLIDSGRSERAMRAGYTNPHLERTTRN
jgi:hypothetical protein